MEPIRSGAPPGPSFEAASPVAASAMDSAVRPPEAPGGIDDVERLILHDALAEDGCAFSRAWLMVWNPRRERLEGWDLAGPPRAGAPQAPSSQAEARDKSHRLEAWRAHSVTPSRLEGAAGRAWREGAEALGGGEGDSMPWRGAPSVGATPLRRGTGLYGLLVGEWDSPEDPPARLVRLDALRRRASAAFEQLDRREEGRRRSRSAQAVSEFARASISALNLAEALHLAARLAAQTTASRGSALWLGEDERALRLEVTHGPTGARERLGRALQPLAESVRVEGRPRLPARLTAEPLLPPDATAQLTGLAVLPVAAYGRVLGVLAVYDRAVTHPAERAEYDALDLEFLATLADMTALVTDQAGRFEKLRRAELRCQELQVRVRREERLASVGELAARAAEDARNPLASIGAFARRVHRELPEDHPHREYLEIVMREAERLESIVGEPARHAPPEPPRLSVESVNAIIQEVLRHAGESLVRRRVRLLKKLSPDVPSLLLDAGRVRHVLANLLDHALSSVPVGGRIRVESRRVHPYVVVEVAHDGPRQPGDSLEQMFVPFASSPGDGRGVGLANARRIVREHGGEIRVRGEAEWPSLISFTLPIHDNQDRRVSPPERRGARADRRRRFPEL